MCTKLLLIQTLGHFFVDAACAAVVISGTSTLSESAIFFILYNGLAFCLQPIAGIILDNVKKITPRQYILISYTLLLLGFLPAFNLWLKVLLVGTGNCLFHVGSGTLILTNSNKKLKPLGIFVSSGAVGLTLGTMFANLWICHTIIIIALLTLIIMNVYLASSKIFLHSGKNYLGIAISLCFCVAIRSFLGFIPLIQFIKTPGIILLITMGVFLGKSLGGILCDRFGIQKTVIISTIFVMLLFLFSFNNPYLWTIVQMIVNLSMPITLYLMWRSMPKYPAFSFGLAAACLVIGLLATFPITNLKIPSACFLFLFMLNSVLVLLAERKLK